MDRKWQQITGELQKRLSRGQYDLWVSSLEFSGLDGGHLILGCRNKFHRDWLREKLEKELIEIASRYFPGVHAVKYTILEDRAKEDRHNGNQRAAPPEQPKQIAFQDVIKPPSSTFNPRFTFDQFVVGQCNQFAYSAAMAMATTQQFPHQSVYLLSETGLGKSHLSQAVGNQLRVQKPELRVRYVTAEQFANELIFSLKNGSIEGFKSKYRDKCDLLLMEGMEFLSGKEKIQNELVYTLDTLMDRGKRIVCTGKSVPKDIPKLSNELHSRLNAVLLASIEPPDFRIRMEIIRRKAHNENVHLPLEVMELLAEQITSDVRQLESCLVGMITKSNLLKVPVNLQLARDVTRTMLDHIPNMTVEHIQETVCSTFKTTLTEMKSKTRRKDVALARQVAMYLCRQYTSQSLGNIGKAFGRSHSSVVYAVNTLSKKMQGKNNKLKLQMDYITHRLETSCLYTSQ